MRFTSLSFPSSKLTGQPLPDRYFTWLTVEQHGTQALGSTGGSFAFAINDIVAPFSKSGAVAASVPGPFVANNTLQPTGLKNLIFNAAVGSGIYQNFRVWAVVLSVTPIINNAGDDIHVAIAPLINNGAAFSSFTSLAQGVGARCKTINSEGNMVPNNTLFASYSMPAMRGMPPNLFAADSISVGSFTATPSINSFVQVQWQSALNAVTVGPVSWRIRMKFLVEFTGRVDSQLFFM